MNLYTIIVGFSDHRQGIGQYEAESALDALKTFVEKSDSLKEFDRKKVLSSISSQPFIHLKNFKGFWIIRFTPEGLSELVGPDGDRILGGHVLQSDPNGPQPK